MMLLFYAFLGTLFGLVLSRSGAAEHNSPRKSL